jgi:nucleotide-binding universal stress UspA family protein
MTEIIVVGVDGSRPSVAALRWAAAEAATRKAEVRAVTAWQPEPMITGPQPVIGLPYRPDEVVRAEHEAVLRATAREAVGEHPPVPVHLRLARGRAPEVLVHEAEHAALLVVGSHGHNWVVDHLLGSVARHCVRHAPCPVVVLPAHLARTDPAQTAPPEHSSAEAAPAQDAPASTR